MKGLRRQILGVLSLCAGVYLCLSLYSYYRWDPSFFTYTAAPARNIGGIVGSHLSDLLMTVAGFASYSVPFFLLVYGVRRILAKERHILNAAGAALLIFSSSLLLHLVWGTFGLHAESRSGGLSGFYIGGFLERFFSLPGAYILSLALFFTSAVILMPFSGVALGRRTKPLVPEPPVEPEKGALAEDILIGRSAAAEAGPPPAEVPAPAEPLLFDHKPGAEEKPRPAPRAPRPRALKPPAAGSAYEMPPVELLTLYDTSSIRPSKEELLTNSSLLETKLADFDVEGKITHVHAGPVVTMYEFEPAPGVKITRVVSLAEDLALSLKAQSMRVSPISGKSTIGIEVPNRQREIVSLREIISSDSFRKSRAKLTLALGKDIFGTPVVADLARMPHLLVAGSTGAGKSVSINSMVMSILYNASPAEVKMLMIDPKLLELSMYEDIPHLISPVITNPRKAAEALRKMVIEMERRYRLLAEKGARNIESYNNMVAEETRLPYVVVFIDELADLMFASSNEVEDSITRLAQMARAAGIHLIIATQRPSVDVITGLIKANFPARISFQVFSKIDSRTILDTQGAEQLLGKGDMLLMLPGSKIVRVHGALVTEDEITEATAFIKSQGSPDYSVFEEIAAAEPADETPSEERDEMYYKAVEFAESVGEVSISSLQRRFKIGYNRAARIMEIMEDDGLVGPPKGAGKPRDYIGRHN